MGRYRNESAFDVIIQHLLGVDPEVALIFGGGDCQINDGVFLDRYDWGDFNFKRLPSSPRHAGEYSCFCAVKVFGGPNLR